MLRLLRVGMCEQRGKARRSEPKAVVPDYTVRGLRKCWRHPGLNARMRQSRAPLKRRIVTPMMRAQAAGLLQRHYGGAGVGRACVPRGGIGLGCVTVRSCSQMCVEGVGRWGMGGWSHRSRGAVEV